MSGFKSKSYQGPLVIGWEWQLVQAVPSEFRPYGSASCISTRITWQLHFIIKAKGKNRREALPLTTKSTQGKLLQSFGCDIAK